MEQQLRAQHAAGREQFHPDPFAEASARLRREMLPRKPRLRQIADDVRNNRLDKAAKQLDAWFVGHPDDADANLLAAMLDVRQGRRTEAAEHLSRCVQRAPDFAAARFEYAKLLFTTHEYGWALKEVDKLLARESGNPLFRQLKARILGATGDDDKSVTIWDGIAADHPDRPECWVSYGNALRAAGQRERAIFAYRRAIACRRSFGLAWWGLANMKTLIFDETDIAAMKEEINRTDLAEEDRINLLFSLAKALEDCDDYAGSFEHYAKANFARRQRTNFEWREFAMELDAQKSLFTEEFFKTRAACGNHMRDPVFILGRPRSGSTLIEQILASHSAVEGTAELPYIAFFVQRFLERECRSLNLDYPQVLAKLDPSIFHALGEEYLERTRAHRKSERPYFVDKCPANYHHIGLIHLILPNARIIDARRNPAACCFSMFKHNYVDTNLRLDELGRVYRDYVSLMAHFDRVLSGRVHRVIYEDVIADPEAEIRKLLDYLDLPFQETCLRFHETKRAVRTPSSEQVRRPISSAAVEHWRHFVPWLTPLLNALGPVFAAYPRVPESLRGIADE